MTEVVLRHPDLPGQPIPGTVLADGTVVPNLGGKWYIDLDTDPVAARLELPPPRAEKPPVTPHFAVPAEEPVAAATAPVQPAEPVTNEQGASSLDPTKESK